MLELKNLHVSVEGQEILKGIDLVVKAGEVHAIMGPNGSGKSTLANVLAGREGYQVTAGSVSFGGRDLLEMDAEVRAGEGLFLAFQYPVEIPGVSNTYFLRTALNALRAYRGQEPVDAADFLALVRDKVKLVRLDESLLKRPVNHGFSGGEKKRDETDSGLDIDALKTVADGVNSLRSPDRAFVVITHYQRLLDHIVPDFVHVLKDGRIVRSGDRELALHLESQGYEWLETEPAAVGA